MSRIGKYILLDVDKFDLERDTNGFPLNFATIAEAERTANNILQYQKRYTTILNTEIDIRRLKLVKQYIDDVDKVLQKLYKI